MGLLSFRKQIARPDNVSGVVNEANDSIAEIVRSLNANAIVNGVFLSDVELNSTSATLVRHGLGYVARGFIVVDKIASFHVYRDTTSTNTNDRQFIALRTSSGTQTVSLWVF